MPACDPKELKKTVKKLCVSAFLSIFNIERRRGEFVCNVLICKLMMTVVSRADLHENKQITNFPKPRFLAENHAKT